MTRNLVLGMAAVVAVACGSTWASAQDHVLQELYGRGVHAFYSRDFTAAHEELTAAIDQGTKDPRCYYFRGMALERLGRPDEAKADFRKGAELELTSDEQIYDIPRSLQRAQGPERIKLEEYRHSVRVEMRKRKLEFEKARYEEFKRNELKVLRKPQPAFDGDDAPAAPPATAPKKPDADDPFGASPAKPATPAKPGAAKPAAEDPFGGPPPKPGKPAKPAADDPFGDAPPAKPAAPKPAADDPFAEEPPAKPNTAKPAPPKPAADDPFADEPAGKPAAPKPAAPKPAPKPEDDPFGT